jgi:hypothetical protein
LTKEDEKTYWGEISYDGNDSKAEGETTPNEDDSGCQRRLIVKGSVIYGYGLEPQPVGRFIMTETTDSKDYDDDDEEEEDDGGLGGLDWSNAFQ